jgi:hypothetical protein
MAQIQSESIVITFSKLVKTPGGSLTNEEIVAALEQVAQELVGEAVIVEVEVAKA